MKTNRILIIGDSIVDRYVRLKYVKNNPESKGNVYKIEAEKLIPGGAAAVAFLCKSLGMEVQLLSVTGADEYGKKLSNMMTDLKINSPVRSSKISTTVKTRYINNDEIYPDRFDEEQIIDVPEKIIDSWSNSIFYYSDIILISDYGKGVVTNYLLNHLPRNKLILVDPCVNRSWGDYNEASIIKANRHEADLALQEVKSTCLLRDIAITLADAYDLSTVITAGNDGIYYSSYDKEQCGHIPAIKTNIKDICGAGDTVFSVLGTMLARGLNLENACKFAVEYATQQIQSIGIQPLIPIDKKERSNL